MNEKTGSVQSGTAETTVTTVIPRFPEATRTRKAWAGPGSKHDRPQDSELERVIKPLSGIHIPHNIIHRVLRESDVEAEKAPQVDSLRANLLQLHVAHRLQAAGDGRWFHEDDASRFVTDTGCFRIVTICLTRNRKARSFLLGARTTENLLTPNEGAAQSLTTYRRRNMKGRKKLARKLGVCRYTLAEYTKVKRMVMPADKKHLLYITCSPETRSFLLGAKV